MVVAAASEVLFAINSLVRLGQQARAAYVDATRRRELTLPLPKFFAQTRIADAVAFFRNADRGRRFVAGSAELQELLPKFDAGTLGAEGEELLKLLHLEYANLRRAERGELVWEGGPTFDAREMSALVTIRQWRRGADPNPSALKRIAGTLVEIGVDYAISTPGLFDERSARGRTLKAFLTSLDEFDFALTNLSEFPARLFVAAVDALGEVPELASGDPRIQDLVHAASAGVSARMAERIQAIESSGLDAIGKQDAYRRVEDWGELVFRSTLAASAERVLEDPARFLGVRGAGEEALVSGVGRALLELGLDDPAGGLDAILGREGLEALLDAALKAVGEHPELLAGDHDGLRQLIAQLARDLKPLNLLEGEVFGEVARLILLRSGENLELLWPELATRPEKNLLLTAAGTTLKILGRAPAEGESWTPRFSRADLVWITEDVVDELVLNPGWLINASGKLSPALSQALTAIVEVLRRRGDRRLSPALAAELVRAALGAVSLRKEFLKKLPAGAQRAGERIIAAALDCLLETVFGESASSQAAWQLVRHEVLLGLVDATLRELAAHELNAAALEELSEALTELVAALANGEGFELSAFVSRLQARLTA